MKIAQPYIKKNKLKKKDFMIWAERDGLFFSLMADVSVDLMDGKCYCKGRVMVKPLWADDIFWEIMDMEANKREPMSLRSIGVFTVYGAKVSEDQYELMEWYAEALELLDAAESGMYFANEGRNFRERANDYIKEEENA